MYHMSIAKLLILWLMVQMCTPEWKVFLCWNIKSTGPASKTMFQQDMNTILTHALTTLLKVHCDPWWNCLFTVCVCACMRSFYCIPANNSSLSPMCAFRPLSLWPDNLHLSLLVLSHSSISLSIPSSLGVPIHPEWWSWSDLPLPFNVGEHVCACTHTHTQAHTQTLCSPPIYLTQCLYSLAPNWLDRWTDDPSLFAPPLSHTLTDTHNKDMPIGLLQEHECVFRTQFFSPNSIHLLFVSVSLHSFNSTKKSIKSSCLTSC